MHAKATRNLELKTRNLIIMQKRKLGKTGNKLSIIGFGGIVVKDVSPQDADRIVGQAIDRGINYFDVAPTYGNAEDRLGPALKPYRDDVFLACKTTQRSAAGAEEELQQSLRNLQTDHFDLYQFHGVSSVDEVDQMLGKGGALDTFLKAREDGLIRNIGFSAHSEDAALKLLDSFEFDSVLFPINSVFWHKGNFGPRLVAKAQSQGIGILALKAMARRPVREGEEKRWNKCWYVPIESKDDARAALSFTLAQGTTAAIPPGHQELLWRACDTVEAGLDPNPSQNAPAFDGEPLFRSKM